MSETGSVRMTIKEKIAMDELAREKLALRDQLDDLRQGFEFWKTHKTQDMELTTLDEMFIRWVENADA